VLWEEQTARHRRSPAGDGADGTARSDLIQIESAPSWSGLTDNYLRVIGHGVLHEGQITPVRLDRLAEDAIEGEITWTSASFAASSAEPSPPTSSSATSRF